MYRRFMDAIAPISESGKLKAILCQFPPYFNCTKENVAYLRHIAKQMGDLPIAVEFRNSSWYSEANKEKNVGFPRRIKNDSCCGR